MAKITSAHIEAQVSVNPEELQLLELAGTSLAKMADSISAERKARCELAGRRANKRAYTRRLLEEDSSKGVSCQLEHSIDQDTSGNPVVLYSCEKTGCYYTGTCQEAVANLALHVEKVEAQYDKLRQAAIVSPASYGAGPS